MEDSSSNSPEIYLEKGRAFGEVALILDSKRTATIVAVEFCIVN